MTPEQRNDFGMKLKHPVICGILIGAVVAAIICCVIPWGNLQTAAQDEISIQEPTVATLSVEATATPSTSQSPAITDTYDVEDYLADLSRALEIAEDERKKGLYDYDLTTRTNEIVAERDEFTQCREYGETLNKETAIGDPSPTPLVSPQPTPQLSMYDGASPWSFQITVNCCDSAPSWLNMSLYATDGYGYARMFDEFDGGGTYVADEIDFMYPGEILVELGAYIANENVDGEVIEYDIDLWDNILRFDLVDWAFDEYMDGIQRGELSASAWIRYDPDPENPLEHETVYEEYNFHAEVFVKKLDYYY